MGCWIGLLLFLCLIFATNIFHFNYRMNADLASDAILGKLIWESRQLIPDSWFIARETRIISTPNIAGGLYGILGNMNLSMGMACVVMTLLILVSAFFCLHKMGYKYDYPIFAFILLMFPANYVLLELLYLLLLELLFIFSCFLLCYSCCPSFFNSRSICGFSKEK